MLSGGERKEKEKNSALPQFHKGNCLASVTLYLALANGSTHFRNSKNNKQAK